MKIAQHAIFGFDMSQVNLNNFWTDRATVLSLDSKDAPFQAVSEYVCIAFRFHNHMLINYIFYFKKWEFLRSHLTGDVRPCEESDGTVKSAKKICFPLAPGPDRAYT